MNRTFYVGDFAKTPVGEGYVVEVMSYVDVVSSMTEVEAKEFNRECQSNYGEDFVKTWQKVQVLHEEPRGIVRWFEVREVDLIKGRPGA